MNARPLISWLTVGLSALALSGCGGGEQVEKFRPSNIVSFGDESSAFVPEASDNVVDGRTVKGFKYTVNFLEISKSFRRGLTLLEDPIVFSNPVDESIGDTYLNQPAWVNFPVTIPPGTASAAWTPVGVTSADLFYIERSFPLAVNYKDKAGVDQTTIKQITYQYSYSCFDNRIWNQILASSYGMSYSKACPLDTREGAETFAEPGAKVAEVITQINTNMGKINSNTLVTVLAGQNDVLEQYEAIYPPSASAPTEGAIQGAEAVLRERARLLAQAINGITGTKARTLVLTLPDLSYSPRVQSQPDAASRAVVMTRLVSKFNDTLFDNSYVNPLGVTDNGRVIGRVKVFGLIQEMARTPGSFGLADGTKAVCDPAKLRAIDTASVVTATNTPSDLKYCNTHTLIDRPTPTSSIPTAYNYLWAQDTWLTPAGHAAIANIAFQRADNDIF